MAWNNSVNAKQAGVQTINSGVWTGSSLTQHSLLVGGASSAITSVSPSATAGVAFVSNGSGADPVSGTVVVAGGGTGLTSLTAHNLIIGNGTSNATLLAPSGASGIPLISGGSSADPSYGTALVAGGGTGLATLTAYAVLAGGTTSTGNIQQVSGVGTSGQFLTSNGAASLPTWQSNPSVLTIAGDSGTATGNTVTLNANSNCGASVVFTASGSTIDLKITDSNSNIFIGLSAGNKTLSGLSNLSFGFLSLASLTTGSGNLAFGSGALSSCTSGTSCTAIGTNALNAFITGSNNIAIGQASQGLASGVANVSIGDASLENTSGSYNSVIGFDACNGAFSGSYNVIIGESSGSNYTTTESNNILIGSAVSGTTGDQNIIRLGSTQTECFIAGISGVTLTGTAVLCSTSGQLGTISSSLRFKKNIKSLDKYSNKLIQCNPVSFNFKYDKTKKVHFGLIAEEMIKIFPELVILDDEGIPNSIAYHEMPALLLNEIIKLRKRVQHLEEEK